MTRPGLHFLLLATKSTMTTFTDTLPATVGYERRTLGRGEALFRQGDPAVAIFAIERGRLRLERHTSDGRLVPLHTARAGETFAEAALFSDSYHCDAVALDARTCVRVYPKRAVLQALGDEHSSPVGLLATMARQLQGLRQRLELRNVRSARERVLLALSLPMAGSANTVDLPDLLQDFASEIGLTREALYRTLAALEREGRIRREGGRIILTNSAEGI
jgi:CRP-like cAMP-binding protein